MQKLRILVVDDEPKTLKYVGTNLRARGYEVLTAADGRTALQMVDQDYPHLVILDIMMPGLDGFAVCQAIRRQSNVPIIMLSARGQEKDIVQALDLGADDYLTKPFGVGEMLARVRAVLRRHAQDAVLPRPALAVGDLKIDFIARRITMGDREVRLTPKEYDLLAHLAGKAGRVFTHRALLQAVWGPEYGDETQYLWVYIQRLRGKIEPDTAHPRYILTDPGVGYAFAAPP